MDNISNLLSISCLQCTSQNDDIWTLEVIKLLLKKAIDLGLDFIALPECSTSLQNNPEITKNLAKNEKESESLEVFKEIAKVNSIYILIGSLPIKTSYLTDLS